MTTAYLVFRELKANSSSLRLKSTSWVTFRHQEAEKTPLRAGERVSEPWEYGKPWRLADHRNTYADLRLLHLQPPFYHTVSYFIVFKCLKYLLLVVVVVVLCMYLSIGQKTICRNGYSPIIWVLEIKRRSKGLASSAFAPWAISLAPFYSFETKYHLVAQDGLRFAMWSSLSLWSAGITAMKQAMSNYPLIQAATILGSLSALPCPSWACWQLLSPYERVVRVMRPWVSNLSKCVVCNCALISHGLREELACMAQRRQEEGFSVLCLYSEGGLIPAG